jgi:CheY-like chemotaxis protein
MDATSESGTTSLIVKCSECTRNYRVHTDLLPEGVSSFPCKACGSLVPIERVNASDGENESAATETHTVLIAVQEEELAALVKRILHGHGYRAWIASSGVEALDKLRQGSVDLLLINVFLPDMMGFEVLDRAGKERDGEPIPSILLSSIHHGTRYKRAPTSLYGASDYIERHHLPDFLIPKIKRLLEKDIGEQVPPGHSVMPPLTDDQVLQRRELEEIENTPRETKDVLDTEILRMCRVIAGDIALYNEDIIRCTEPHKLLETIAEDLREGEELLERRFPEVGENAPQLIRKEIVLLMESRGIQIP